MRRTMLLLTVMAAVLVMASGVALAVARSGGPGNDILRGTNGPDAMKGNGGHDVLLGYKGTDALSGGTGRDAVLGGDEHGPTAGDKALEGGPGGDFVHGGHGTEAVSGGSGRDFLVDGPLRDEDQDSLGGGDGRDAIDTFNRPASTDAIDCGSGFDRVLVDSKDVTKNCERKYSSPRAFYNSIPNSYFEPLSRIPPHEH
jgi:RTX calcium-binding nonapeptide repeat (4 copies)